MARKAKHRGAVQLSVPELKTRTEKAVREGRYQQALELGKQLYKQDPAPPHKELLQTIYLGRSRQLRLQGNSQDAGAMLDHALTQLGGQDSAWLEQMAEELAACGHAQRALGILERIGAGTNGAQTQGRILAQAADAALQRGPDGRNLLPQTLQGPFDLILKAFAQLEAGQDGQVPEILQGIGLQSSFLEWKLLLRGLQAYYQNDDPRAVENWQRLNPDRLPARLAAPLRFRIDPAFRQVQPAQTQAVLQKQAERLQASGLIQPLRDIQAALAHEQLHQAFRLADGIVPAMRREAPHLVPRLAACFYWAIVRYGQQQDIQRYQRLFGTPADDPQFARLQALVMEHMHELPEAHRYWQQFEQSVANNPAAWPGEQAARARALIWCHMGHNAAAVPDPDEIPDLPPFLCDHPDRPRPLNPSAEECFQRALKLAPDQLELYEALFHYYQEHEENAQAEQAARRLLERFPEHVKTLVELGDTRLEHKDYAEALSLFQRALKANPLDRQLRAKVSTAHTFNARPHVEAGQFDEARAEYRAALALREGPDEYSVLCKWAACEFKAGDPAQGEDLLGQALAGAGGRLAVAYSMLIEAIRLKLPKLKKRFQRDFTEALAEPPTGAAAAAIAEMAAAHQSAGVRYHGQKVHEKKVLLYLDKALAADFSATQLERVCSALLNLKALKPLGRFARLARKRFPANPFFPFVEAEGYFSLGPQRCPVWKVRPLLDEARRLASAMPPDNKQQALLEALHQREEMAAMAGTFGGLNKGLFEQMLDQLFGGPDDGDDGDEDEDEDEEEAGWSFNPFGRRRKRRQRQRR